MNKNNKGVILVIVLATILVTVLLATAVMHIISSQSRLTHHQLSRIQAYYANKAAITYAQEQLRTGAWPVPAAGASATYNCNSVSCAFGLNLATDFKPASITSIALVIRPAQNTNNTQPCYRSPLDTKTCIDCTTVYTYP